MKLYKRTKKSIRQIIVFALALITVIRLVDMLFVNPIANLLNSESVYTLHASQVEPRVSPTPVSSVIADRGKVDFGNEVKNLIYIYFGHNETAFKVAKCESGFNPKAKNTNSTASGVFQILKGTFKTFKCEGDPVNAEDNIRCARKIYDYYHGDFGTSGGWEASKHCWSR